MSESAGPGAWLLWVLASTNLLPLLPTDFWPQQPTRQDREHLSWRYSGFDVCWFGLIAKVTSFVPGVKTLMTWLTTGDLAR